MGMRTESEKEELSEGKRKALVIIASILIVGFVAFMFYTGQVKDKESTPEPTNNDPVQQDTQTPAENQDEPDDIGVTESSDTDFITGGSEEGLLRQKDTSKQLDDQGEIYSAVKAAEGAMWTLLNYDSETDEKEREELLKVMFTKDTPVDLTLPSKKDRKDEFGGSFEYHVNFDAQNGQGGDADDYRVQLVGTRQTVTIVKDNLAMSEEDTNGFDKIETENLEWTVSLKQVKGKTQEDNYWLVYNYSENTA